MTNSNRRPTLLPSLWNSGCGFTGRIILGGAPSTDGVRVLVSGEAPADHPGFGAYLSPDHPSSNLVPLDVRLCAGVSGLDTLVEGDVVEFLPNGLIRIAGYGDSSDQTLVVTNRCNCGCVMCPDPMKIRAASPLRSVQELTRLVSLFPRDTRFLVVTGGEPTLLKDGLFEVLLDAREVLPNAQVILLSNGRMFYYRRYAEKLKEALNPDAIVAVPIHGHQPNVHDTITRASGSLDQTLLGVKNLLDLGVQVELRVVTSRMSGQSLVGIMELIASQFPTVYRVNLMALEMSGDAAANREVVWVPFEELRGPIRRAVRVLSERQIPVFLYNFPLCHVDEDLWPIAMKSISPEKVAFTDECKDCSVLYRCGGIFASTLSLMGPEVRPCR